MPRKHHPKNERIKRAYLAYLQEAKCKTEASANIAAAAIADFEAANNWKDFAAFHVEQARRYRRLLGERTNEKTGKPLSKSTIYSRLMVLRAFIAWLAEQPGYKARIKRTDCDYFNPTANDARIATARRERPAPNVETVRRLVERMPADTDIQKRDRALIAFTLLSGARDDAIASLNIGHVDLERRTVDQDARQVRTKNRKTLKSVFFPVGEDVEDIVRGWIEHLRGNLLFGPDHPLFPATRIAVGVGGGFEAAGLEPRHWKDAGPIRRIFRKAFEEQGLPYVNPHTFRKTLARQGETLCRTPEEFKAWSQNLGHEGVLTTFTSYGEVSAHRQVEIMDELRRPKARSDHSGDPDKATIQRVVDYMARMAGVSGGNVGRGL